MAIEHITGKVAERGHRLFDEDNTQILIEKCSECRKIVMDSINKKVDLEALCCQLAGALSVTLPFAHRADLTLPEIGEIVAASTILEAAKKAGIET